MLPRGDLGKLMNNFYRQWQKNAVPDERMIKYDKELSEEAMTRKPEETFQYKQAQAWSRLGHQVVGAEYQEPKLTLYQRIKVLFTGHR